MKKGWKTHVPLSMLTDAYCRSQDATTPHDESAMVVKRGRILTTTLSDSALEAAELKLELKEWLQAYKRLLFLVRNFFGTEYAGRWKLHFNNIFNHLDRDDEWPAMIRYDIRMRKKATEGPLDPARWQSNIYDRILHKLKFPDVAVPFPPQSAATNPTPAPNHLFPNLPSVPPSAHLPAKPRQDSNSNTRARNHDKTSRCFRCGTQGHGPTKCTRTNETIRRHTSPGWQLAHQWIQLLLSIQQHWGLQYPAMPEPTPHLLLVPQYRAWGAKLPGLTQGR
jgi:hypothetical protein